MVAAPFCGKLLASLGADVLKIEPPRTGDPSRRRGPFPQDVPHPERSGLYLYVNTGKRGITLDLEDPEGRQVFSKLSQEADVVLHDLPPDPAHRLGLSTESISTESISTESIPSPNSELIVAAITPFGSSGPHSGFNAYDVNVFHAGGEGNLLPNGLALDHFPDRAPITAGSFMASYQGGVTAAVAVTAAVFARLSGAGGSSSIVPCRKPNWQSAIFRCNGWRPRGSSRPVSPGTSASAA